MPSTLLTSNSYAANSGDNTIWRAQGTAISNAFSNSGWTRVADSGIVDWTTVVANGTANNNQVNAWEIFRMTDPLQNTVPVFVKLSYYTFYTTNSPGIVLSLGGGTDGAGNLTGAVSNGIWLRMSTGAAANTWLHAYRGDSSSITMALSANNQHSGYPIFLNIERVKDANGNDTANGVIVQFAGIIYSGVGPGYYQFYWNPFHGNAPVESDIGAFIQNTQYWGSGNTIHLYPIHPNRGIFINPFLNSIYAYTGHVAVNSPFPVTYYGGSHTYVALPTMTGGWTNRSSQSTSSFHLCMRWE
jgi:hypothetical protein